MNVGDHFESAGSTKLSIGVDGRTISLSNEIKSPKVRAFLLVFLVNKVLGDDIFYCSGYYVTYVVRRIDASGSCRGGLWREISSGRTSGSNEREG